MSQKGRGCLVADQGGSDKVAQFKTEGRGTDPQFPHWIRACNCSQRVWKENGILSFLIFFVCFLRTYISYEQCIENNNKIYD